MILFPSSRISSDVRWYVILINEAWKSLLGREERFWESVCMGSGDRPSSCRQSSHLGCEDRNMKLEEPHWTMRKTSRSMLRQANSPGVDEDEASIVPLTLSHWTNQPQNHTRLIFIWGETLLFQFAETRFLVNIPKYTLSSKPERHDGFILSSLFFKFSHASAPSQTHLTAKLVQQATCRSLTSDTSGLVSSLQSH